ncbi:UvrD-helicase domain-containing protein [Marinifilum sp. RC60d5]|uniref:UvrD-helicase domain-containing protein n=1 Tax=Marinifilum sp. RC60d5 TaxID=3458414 RepID=UPI004035ABAC
MKVLLAGPGTGKTTNIRGIIDQEYSNAKSVLILSFTNATVNDLNDSFETYDNVRCRTLHSYAMSINPMDNFHILHPIEIKSLEKLSIKIEVDFNTICEQLRCTTFSNMISTCSSFIKNNPVYIQDVIGKIDLLVVDEFQDFNESEQELVFELAKIASETIILGDDDQSIYGFKDADPDVLISLHNDKNVINLEHENNCYRCPDCIVDISSALIKENKNRVDKPWNKIGKDGNLYIDQILDCDEVNIEILQRINAIRKTSEDSILILSPVKNPLISVMEFLTQNDIPIVDFIGNSISIDELQRIWLLRSIYSNHKILNLIFYHINIGLIDRKGFQTIIKEGLDSDINGATVIAKLLELNKIEEPFKSYLSVPPALPDFNESHPEFSNLVELIDEDNLLESISKLTKELTPQAEFEPDKVNIMTIHKSKGLGADHVFLLGAVQGIVPNSKKGLDTIEAQRRLLFVAMTRAKKSLHIISQVNWTGRFVNTVNKDEFKYNWRKKTYQGRMSEFIKK